MIGKPGEFNWGEFQAITAAACPGLAPFEHIDGSKGPGAWLAYELRRLYEIQFGKMVSEKGCFKSDLVQNMTREQFNDVQSKIMRCYGRKGDVEMHLNNMDVRFQPIFQNIFERVSEVEVITKEMVQKFHNFDGVIDKYFRMFD